MPRPRAPRPLPASRIPRNRLYGDLAWLWPYLSDPADYAREATYWRRALRRRLGRGRHSLLELGVGGGSNLSHLTAHYDATAVDLSEAMLDHSRRLNPGVEHLLGDMRSVRLGRTFDAVLIHDALDHLTTERDLRRTFATAAAHLEPGGLLVIAPYWYRDGFRPPYVEHTTRADARCEVTYVEYTWDPNPRDTKIEAVFSYFIRRGGSLVVERDRLEFGIFPMRTWLGLLREAGFTVERDPYPVADDGRELWLLVGRK